MSVKPFPPALFRRDLNLLQTTLTVGQLPSKAVGYNARQYTSVLAIPIISKVYAHRAKSLNLLSLNGLHSPPRSISSGDRRHNATKQADCGYKFVSQPRKPMVSAASVSTRTAARTALTSKRPGHSRLGASERPSEVQNRVVAATLTASVKPAYSQRPQCDRLAVGAGFAWKKGE